MSAPPWSRTGVVLEFQFGSLLFEGNTLKDLSCQAKNHSHLLLFLIFLLYFCSRYTCSEWNTTILYTFLKIYCMHGIPYYILQCTTEHTMLGTVSHNAMLSVWPFISSSDEWTRTTEIRNQCYFNIICILI